MDAQERGALITVVSARADGATAVSMGLAAFFGDRGRTVLADLNLDHADVAPFLDLAETKTVYHLAYAAQLGPISDEDLREHLQWRDDFAVLPGITYPRDREQLTVHFLAELVGTLRTQFDFVVVDAGRARAELNPDLVSGSVLWVVTPRPTGLSAFDHAWHALEDSPINWLQRVQVVLNRLSPDTLADVPAFLRAEYGRVTAGQLADGPDFWSRAELSHSLGSLTIPITDQPRFVRAHGEQALRMRTDLGALVGPLASPVPVGAR